MTSPYTQFHGVDNTPTNQPGGVAMQPMNYGNNATMIQIQNSDFHVEGKFSWAHFVMSIITLIMGCICCANPLSFVFSLLGIVYSSNSYHSYGEKAWERSRRQNFTAKVFWIISMVFICIALVVLIIAVAIVASAAKAAVDEVHSINNNNNHNFNGK